MHEKETDIRSSFVHLCKCMYGILPQSKLIWSLKSETKLNDRYVCLSVRPSISGSVGQIIHRRNDIKIE